MYENNRYYEVQELNDNEKETLYNLGCHLHDGSVPHQYKVVNKENGKTEFLSSNVPTANNAARALFEDTKNKIEEKHGIKTMQ